MAPGGLVLALARGQVIVTVSGGQSFAEALVSASLIGGPGPVLLYHGYRLPRTDPHRDGYPRPTHRRPVPRKSGDGRRAGDRANSSTTARCSSTGTRGDAGHRQVVSPSCSAEAPASTGEHRERVGRGGSAFATFFARKTAAHDSTSGPKRTRCTGHRRLAPNSGTRTRPCTANVSVRVHRELTSGATASDADHGTTHRTGIPSACPVLPSEPRHAHAWGRDGKRRNPLKAPSSRSPRRRRVGRGSLRTFPIYSEYGNPGMNSSSPEPFVDA
ncbi:hypothetical protein BRC93_10835 [Halobacteriales archaeon QS_5_70_15]|nr:MAG: hypothetical protein BRC93_10835 [Halobacteriales archaeon QS_5_70_15]